MSFCERARARFWSPPIGSATGCPTPEVGPHLANADDVIGYAQPDVGVTAALPRVARSVTVARLALLFRGPARGQRARKCTPSHTQAASTTARPGAVRMLAASA